ncbi:MAG: hypothetical protein JKY37_30770, partial [Nannocystaceae bacterium]|nr:hypothetical protein [Nannocystaceae bacterium]
PAAGARHVLREGGVWMDMGADPATTQQLLALHVPDPKGHVVVGVGLFPGLLTMLGGYVAELVSPCERIDLGVRLSTLSGAGRGSCRVMVEMLRQPGLDFVGGKQRERPAFGDARPIPYLGTGLAASTAVTLADTVLVRRVSQAPAVASHLALVPSWLRPLFVVSQWVIERAGPLRELVLGLTYRALLALRSLALRWLDTRVQLTAVANAGCANETVRALDFASGVQGTALGTAAVVLLWRDIEAPPPGTHSAAGLFGLDEALVRLTHAGLTPPRLVDPTAEPRSLHP